MWGRKMIERVEALDALLAEVSAHRVSRVRLSTARARLLQSAVIERRSLATEEFVAQTKATVQQKLKQVGQERAEAAAAGQLRNCALASCGAKEAHVSHFSRCAACKGVVYCCREHQVADWPQHKAACKAVRKAASAKDVARRAGPGQ